MTRKKKKEKKNHLSFSVPLLYTCANILLLQAGPKIKEAIESFEDDVSMDDSMMA